MRPIVYAVLAVLAVLMLAAPVHGDASPPPATPQPIVRNPRGTPPPKRPAPTVTCCVRE